ncbi:10380_t:CDS:10 [Funneliformis geosporum]|nr:10380_t:CDS:10 [Funneliformis geosporum]
MSSKEFPFVPQDSQEFIEYFPYGSKIKAGDESFLKEQQEFKNSSDFYEQAPFLKIAKCLVKLIKAGKVEEIIFLSAYDKRKFPDGDDRKYKIFKEKVKYDDFEKVKGALENVPDLNVFIDDNPIICGNVEATTDLEDEDRIIVCSPHYPIIETQHINENVLLIENSVIDIGQKKTVFQKYKDKEMCSDCRKTKPAEIRPLSPAFMDEDELEVFNKLSEKEQQEHFEGVRKFVMGNGIASSDAYLKQLEEEPHCRACDNRKDDGFLSRFKEIIAELKETEDFEKRRQREEDIMTKQTLIRDDGRELTFHCVCGKVTTYPKPKSPKEEFIMNKTASSGCLTCQNICEIHHAKKELITFEGKKIYKEFICSSCNMPTDKCEHGTFCREHAVEELRKQKEELENEKNGTKTLEFNKDIPNEEKKMMIGEFKGKLVREKSRCEICEDKAIRLLEVGSMIINPKNNTIIATGYNGLPRGCSDDEFP